MPRVPDSDRSRPCARDPRAQAAPCVSGAVNPFPPVRNLAEEAS
jgi:hypothetical protein